MAINPDNSTATSEQKLSAATATLRRINLNVDLATQAELISAYNELTSMIHADESNLSVDVVKQDTAENGYASTYYITQGGAQVGVKINIPKDMVISSGSLKTVTTADEPYAGAAVGDKYIELVLANATNDKIYIPVNDLFDSYTSGSSPSDGIVVTVDNATNTISASGANLSASLVGADTDLSSAATIWGAKAYAKDYADSVVASKNVDAEGDDIVGASAANNKVTVTASNALCAVVSKVQTTSADWDEAEQNAKDYANGAIETAVNALSTVYASKTTVDTAAGTLNTAITSTDLTAYQDIDQIITELEALKTAVKNFATSMTTA